MLSAFKKFGKNVKKAGKSMEDKFEKAGTAMKEAASNSPSKHHKKDEDKSEDRKTHKDDDTRSKRSKKSKHDEQSKAASDVATRRDSDRGSDVHSTRASVAPPPPSVPARASSVASSRQSKPKEESKTTRDAKPDKNDTAEKNDSRSEPKAKAKSPRATTPVADPSDIAFQIEDVSPGPSLERPPSAAPTPSDASSIQLEEEEPVPPARAEKPAASSRAAPTKVAAPVAELHADDASDGSHSIDFQGEEAEVEPAAAAVAREVNDLSLDDAGEATDVPKQDSPRQLAETARGPAATDKTSSSRNTAPKSKPPTTAAASTTSSMKARGASAPPKKRQVTIGDADRTSTARADRTNAAFARTENKRAEELGTEAHPIQARPTADARYRGHAGRSKQTAEDVDAATPERRAKAPRRPAPDAIADIPDNSSTYVSPTRRRRHSAHSSDAERPDRRDDVDGDQDDQGEEGVRGYHRHRRRHRSSRSARDARSDRGTPADSTPRSREDEEAGAAHPVRAPVRPDSRRQRRDGDGGAAAVEAAPRRSHRRRASPPRRDREAVLSARRYVSDPLDYREMMDQCRREARALSYRRARRAGYASESDLEEDMRDLERDGDDRYDDERGGRRRYRGFRDDAADWDDGALYDDVDGDDSAGSFDSQTEFEYNAAQREYYRGRRRFPASYTEGSPSRRAEAPVPDPTRTDRSNVGRFYPSLVQPGPPSLSSDAEALDGRHQHDSSYRDARRGSGSRRATPSASSAVAPASGRRRRSPVTRPTRSPPRPQSGRSGRGAGDGLSSRERTPQRSPLRGRASLYTSPSEPQPLVPRTRSAASDASPRRRGGLPTRSHTPNGTGATPPQSEEALLEQIEFKMGLLAEQIAFEDEVREDDMRRSPFERLYHMNNRRDRDERRQRLAQYHKLETLRDKLITGAFEKDMAAQQAKRVADAARLDDPSGVFNRLYRSPRRRGPSGSEAVLDSSQRGNTPLRGGTATDNGAHHSRSSSAAGGGESSEAAPVAVQKLSKEALESLCLRLYGGAVAATQRREEDRERAEKARELKDMEDFLVGRLVMEMERRLNGRVLTSEELHARAREELEKRMKADPAGTEQELIRGARLKKRDAEAQAKRLARQGYVSKEALAAKKEKEELTGCTFEPAINEYYFYSATADRDKSGAAGRSSSANTSNNLGDTSALSTSGGARRPQRTDVLFARAEKERHSAALRREEYDREMRLKVLRSRMASDHHFRRRVELDPGLAQRFMKSIVI